MSRKPTISVIAIFYNSSEFCGKCINSILNQDYPYLDIILVDDCSTDSTKKILYEYAEKDPRIRLIINEQNRGISEARNSGLRTVKGECFFFIDGDDFLSKKESLSILVSHWSPDMDWVSGSYEFVDETGNVLKRNILPTRNCNNRDEILNNFSEIDFVYTHNRLISSRFKNIFFPAKKMHEDRFWNLQIYSGLNKIIQLSDVTYSYLSRTSSFSSRSRFRAQ